MLMRDDKQDENGWAASFIAAVIIIAVAYGLALGVYLSYRAYCHEQDEQRNKNIEWSKGDGW